MPEVDVVRAGAGVLISHLVARLITKLGEAESVKVLWVRPEGGGFVDGLSTNHNGVALRDQMASGGAKAGS